MPDRITALISQNGNAYVEGLSEGWNRTQAYWKNRLLENRAALRAFLEPKTTRWQYTDGVLPAGALGLQTRQPGRGSTC